MMGPIDYDEIGDKIVICKKLLMAWRNKIPFKKTLKETKKQTHQLFGRDGTLEVFWDEISFLWEDGFWVVGDITYVLEGYQKFLSVSIPDSCIQHIYASIYNEDLIFPDKSLGHNLCAYLIKYIPPLKKVPYRILLKYAFNDLYYLIPDQLYDSLRIRDYDEEIREGIGLTLEGGL